VQIGTLLLSYNVCQCPSGFLPVPRWIDHNSDISQAIGCLNRPSRIQPVSHVLYMNYTPA
jgi:hypothetical protein